MSQDRVAEGVAAGVALPPRASVVVPSRGGASRLHRLMTALAAQSHADTEIVVVLDGDVDGSRNVLAGWVDRLDLRVVIFPENRGRSAALNAGFEAATGEVLIRCDDDLEPRPGHVARHVSHHIETSTPVGVIGLCPNVFPETDYARKYGIRRERIFRDQAFALPAGQRWRLWGANVSVTRQTWDRVGTYDLAYRAYGMEDVDWGYRLHALGTPIALDPDLDAPHHGAATTTTIRASRAFHSGAARRTFERLHGTTALGSWHQPAGLWDRAVRATGRHTGPTGSARMARLTDRALPLLPRYAAEKAIAFTIESAAIAGHTHPGSAEATF